jgi:hypothetical protein
VGAMAPIRRSRRVSGGRGTGNTSTSCPLLEHALFGDGGEGEGGGGGAGTAHLKVLNTRPYWRFRPGFRENTVRFRLTEAVDLHTTAQDYGYNELDCNENTEPSCECPFRYWAFEE